MNRTRKIVATVCGVLVALAWTVAAPARPGGASTGIVLGAVHADVTTIDARGQTRRYSWDRGRVTSRNDTSITIARRDGKTVTLGLGEQTRVRAKNGRLSVGDLVVAYSREGVVYLVLAFQTREAPPPPKKSESAASQGQRTWELHENVLKFSRLYVHVDWALVMPDGKRFTLSCDRGEVTARTATSITLERADGRSVTVAVGERTRFSRDGVEIGDRAVVYSRDGAALNVVAGTKTRK